MPLTPQERLYRLSGKLPRPLRYWFVLEGGTIDAGTPWQRFRYRLLLKLPGRRRLRVR